MLAGDGCKKEEIDHAANLEDWLSWPRLSRSSDHTTDPAIDVMIAQVVFAVSGVH